MDRLLLLVGAVTVAGAVALLVSRRRPAPPANPSAHVPAQLDRTDFPGVDRPWLLALFSAESCGTCAGVWELIEPLSGPDVVVVDLEVGREAELHARYRIDGVPTLVLADSEGVVRRSFLGPVDRDELHAAMASLHAGPGD